LSLLVLKHKKKNYWTCTKCGTHKTTTRSNTKFLIKYERKKAHHIPSGKLDDVELFGLNILEIQTETAVSHTHTKKKKAWLVTPRQSDL
jgi:hypothetical protein